MDFEGHKAYDFTGMTIFLIRASSPGLGHMLGDPRKEKM